MDFYRGKLREHVKRKEYLYPHSLIKSKPRSLNLFAAWT